MKTNEIKKLIKSFYDGETSQSEELLLQDYFNSNDVAEELLEEKELFLQFHETDNISTPKSLESKLHFLIDDLEKQDSNDKPKSIKQKLVFWSIAAAGVAILLLAGVYMNNTSYHGVHNVAVKTQNDTYNNNNNTQITDAEYVEAEQALLLLAANFNKGMKQLDEMNSSLDHTNKILNKTFPNN